MSTFTDTDSIKKPFLKVPADPNSMLSNHVAPEYVRQLDKTALKNCMELALLRHEKELSVR